jgi:tetratricopeptide (TPR) repeat protein
MIDSLIRPRGASVTLVTFVATLYVGLAFAAIMPAPNAPSGSTWLGNIELVPSPTMPTTDAGADTDIKLSDALRRGQWRRACSAATQVLADRQPNLEAVGVFGLCAAIRGDGEAVAAAQKRLKASELPPIYYTELVQGVVDLRNKSAEKADVAFRAARAARPEDPLALYFSGEASHARGKDAEALVAFRAVLKTWPDYVPALVGTAKLLSPPKASKKELEQAIALSERAANLEPMNLGHWKLLAELCDRIGQPERATAIRLQWLSQPELKKK